MNFCCHDDFTLTGNFLTNDVDILAAYQVFVSTLPSSKAQDAFDIDKFRTYYQTAVDNGQATDLSTFGNSIQVLPAFDCVDYTETGTILTNDVDIYRSYQVYATTRSSAQQADIKDVNKFRAYYQDAVDNGQATDLSNFDNEIKHLPTLETDSTVPTIRGIEAKGGEGFSAEIVSAEQAESDENLSENDLLISLDCTSAVHLNDTSEASNIKAVEIVFDNVEFLGEGEQNGLSYLEGGLQENVFNDTFEDTSDKATLDYYYDYSIRTTGTEPRNNRSVIGFIDTKENGNGENKITLGKIKLKVNNQNYSIIEEISPEIQVADIRIWDETTEVERYELVSCGSSTSGDE